MALPSVRVRGEPSRGGNYHQNSIPHVSSRTGDVLNGEAPVKPQHLSCHLKFVVPTPKAEESAPLQHQREPSHRVRRASREKHVVDRQLAVTGVRATFGIPKKSAASFYRGDKFRY